MQHLSYGHKNDATDPSITWLFGKLAHTFFKHQDSRKTAAVSNREHVFL